ncbi:MAG: glutamate-5-semialdehyde dehydrogenase [Clostridiales bacterium GWF2_38_85]|nr:MAG: glutamate-5-semialdehyde dehydrogenase [Clostridiales bacterium GWF2_38_85]HBL84740.1 glutamate-5-semialdehyde dehydrogenase [Clostridiales bacterium]
MNSREVLIEKCLKAKTALTTLAASKGAVRNAAVIAMADALVASKDEILAANNIDIENTIANNTRESMIDRLRLTSERIDGISASLKKVAALPDPLGDGTVWNRPNGLTIRKIKVPLGLIGIIYEARPNVTADAAVLCIKSGNCVLLRGGSSAINSNLAITKILRDAIASVGLSAECIQIAEDTSREDATELMKLNGYVDLLIPRGGASLIRSVVENATIPVIETGAGNCHVYIDSDTDLDMAVAITVNAKTQRPSVCNAAETLLVHKDIADKFLPLAANAMPRVELRGCDKTLAILSGIKSATEEDWVCEYNDYIFAVKVVDSIQEAVTHINKYNTKHSEAIVTKNIASAEYFKANVDAAAVYVNASTRFTDGEEFGFGAEIGISTQKLHARGPMGLDALTTIKYLIDGDGQIR